MRAGPNVRPATEAEFVAVMGLLEGALLEVEPGTVREAIGAGDALVAVEGGRPPAGALVLDGERIAAVAVRPARRREGVGSALVAAAADRRDRLLAEFRPELAPFYRALGFVVERRGDRCRGRLE
jgi:GNAT superfamily N-acetyltransferase